MGSCMSVIDGSSPSSMYSSSSPSSSSAAAASSCSVLPWLRRERRRAAAANASVELPTDDQLARIPGRIFANGSSSIACLFTQQGRKGTNQDAMLVWEDFGSNKDTVFCGVFDGHGPFGHLVAKRVRDSLPSKLCSQWQAIKNSEAKAENGQGQTVTNSEDETMDEEWREEEEEDKHEQQQRLENGGDEADTVDTVVPEAFLAWKESFLKAFKVMDKELRLHPIIDCFCSGTTAVTLVKQGRDLVMGNVGDSRAVLATRDSDDALRAVQLTVDLKPNLPKEAERIKQFKGRVFALQDEPDVARVWLPNEDSPGLAMARAFGDFCLKDFGLIAVPDISYRRVTERDEFIVLATDGVWDVLSNKEVVDIVANAPTRTSAARSLVEFAVRAWRLKYPTSKVDDCAVVCLYLNDPCASSASASASVLSQAISVKEGAVALPTKAVVDEVENGDAEGEMPASPTLGRLNTVRNASASASSKTEIEEEICTEASSLVKQPERSQSRRSLAECLSVAEDDEWSALEGVSRVNSLLNLPRYLTGGDRYSGRWRKHR